MYYLAFNNSTHDTFIASVLPSKNKQQSILLGVGNGSVLGVKRSYIKLNLPTLTSADLITDARLYLSLYPDNYSNTQIDAHYVKLADKRYRVKKTYNKV